MKLQGTIIKNGKNRIHFSWIKKHQLNVGKAISLLILALLFGCASNKPLTLENASNNNFTEKELRIIIEQQEITPEMAEDISIPILYKVSSITDGDTLTLNTGDKVRLICIDAPERGDYYYEEASNYLEDLILNKEVTLLKDFSETDRYGRLLRYIYVEDIFVNYALVEEGYAKVYRYPPDTSKCDELEQAEDIAKLNKLGIWKSQEQVPAPTSSNTETSLEYVCSSNFYNCGDFRTHAEAQAVYEACGGKKNDVHRLDRDKDGLACEG